MFFALYLNSTRKMCSFEVHDDYIAQEVKDWEGASISYNCNYEAPLTFLVFEQHRDNVDLTFSVGDGLLCL